RLLVLVEYKQVRVELGDDVGLGVVHAVEETGLQEHEHRGKSHAAGRRQQARLAMQQIQPRQRSSPPPHYCYSSHDGAGSCSIVTRTTVLLRRRRCTTQPRVAPAHPGRKICRKPRFFYAEGV